MTESFDDKLQKYAELVIHAGIRVRAGQRLIIRAPLETAPFARLAVEKAYRAGARMVDVIWTDEAVTLARFRHAPRDSFEEVPISLTDPLLRGSERGDAVLSIYGADPDLLRGQDPKLIATFQQAFQRYTAPFQQRVISNHINWTVIGVPVAAWASKVFPDLPATDRVPRLWDAIFSVCRVDRPDPVAEWEKHLAALLARREILDAKQYRELRYRGPGTELTVGLPENHRWLGGRSVTSSGHPFVANIPTDEVFTMPHRNRVDGVVRTTKPLSYAGTVIRSFELTFSGGSITGVTASNDAAVLESLIGTDEGSRRLGEVALVAHSSPVSRTGLLFYNTLYDENASCHLAIGKAYRSCVEGGVAMTDEAFAAAGGNSSLTHVDFMLGGPELAVDGVRPDGTVEPVLRNGEWAIGT